MHKPLKPQFNFKKCLQEGAARHEKGAFYACNRKEPCHIKADLGCMSPFCSTPLNEQIRRDEQQARARKSA